MAPKASADPLARRNAQSVQRVDDQFSHFQEDAPACDTCGSITVRNGNCYKCFNCGSSLFVISIDILRNEPSRFLLVDE